MAYSTEEIQDLKNRIDAALTGGGLKAWETKFLTDIRARLGRYGTKTRLSDKQVKKLRDIVGSQRALAQLRAAADRRKGKSKHQREKTSAANRRGRRPLVSARLFLLALAFGAIAGYLVLELPANPLSALPTISQQAARGSAEAITGRASVIDGDT